MINILNDKSWDGVVVQKLAVGYQIEFRKRMNSSLKIYLRWLGRKIELRGSQSGVMCRNFYPLKDPWSLWNLWTTF